MNIQPNFVFVLTDDQGFPTLGVHGHPFIQTPNLDKFSRESINFSQFHCGTTCAPTRAGLMTGHYCNSTGVWHTIGGRSLLRKDEWSLADALSENGYNTGMFGKWHLGDEYPYRPQDRGFNKVVYHGGGGIGNVQDWWGNDYFDDVFIEDGEPKPFKGYCTDVFFREGIKFIQNNKSNPFFSFISTNAPHLPFNVEKKYRDIYINKTKNEYYARFLGMITNIDDNFKILLKTLDNLNLSEKTILVFMSDNGQTESYIGPSFKNEFNCGMRGLKGSEYEGGHRVPFIIRYPWKKILGGKIISDLTSYVDLMPTILDLCEIKKPNTVKFHGNSLVGLIKYKDKDFWKNRILVTDTQRVSVPIKWKNSCVMKNKWRLVNRHELYDLNQDFGQKNNVSQYYPYVVKELQNAYEEWWKICSTQINEEIPISIGSNKKNKTLLTTHDLRNEHSDVVWNQKQVRKGQICIGYWEVFFENSANYEFQLRRWPRESGHLITEGINGCDIEYRKNDIAPGEEDNYKGGTKLNIDSAALIIGSKISLYTDVNEKDEMAKFKLFVKSGYYHLRAFFSSSKNNLFMSPYYINILMS